MNSSTATSPSSRPARPAPLRVGLTGGIASGKSTVAGLFSVLGVPVIDTDQVAREVVAPGTAGLAAVVARFGHEVLQDDGTLDRRALRQRVFADPQARADLEALLHPLIHAATQQHSLRAKGPYHLIAVPLLAEKGLRDRYDRVLVVDCDPTLQRSRVMLRDRCDEAAAQAILDAQASRAQRLAVADDVLVNDGDLRALARRVAALHQQYLAISGPARPQ